MEMTKEKEIQKAKPWKIRLVFGLISVVVHMYLIFLLYYLSNLDPIKNLFRVGKIEKEEPIEVVVNDSFEEEKYVVQTFTRSKTIPKKGKISDKPNQSSAPKVSKKESYNYMNKNPGVNTIKNSEVEKTEIPKKIVPKQEEKTVKKVTASEDLPKTDEANATASINKEHEKKVDEPVVKIKSVFKETVLDKDYHITYGDPDKLADVMMNNSGDISLATVPSEFAPYFLSMQKKIGENWQKFFPVFSYYQGIIKKGTVTVRFEVNHNGDVLSTRIVQSLNYPSLDNASLNAVKYSRNFGPVPEKLRTKETLVIYFKFLIY